MSLISSLTSFVQTVGTDIKSLLSSIGELSSLKTQTKTNLVSAINEAYPNVSWLSTKGGSIVDKDGNEVILRGCNYPGQGAPNGLDSTPYSSITYDGVFYEGNCDKIARLGFNCVRLTVCEDTTWSGAVTTTAYIDGNLNPDFFTSTAYTDSPQPLKTDIEILDLLIEKFSSLGVRVILDMHNLTRDYDPSKESKWYSTTNPGDTGATAGVAFEPRSEAQWIAAWEFFATRYKDNPYVCGFDLFNEPHGCTWDDDANTGWPAAVERCATQIQAINPNVLIIAEGVPQTITVDNIEMTSGWSSGLTLVKTRPINLSVSNKVVYSAHEYASYSADASDGTLDGAIFSAPNFPQICIDKFRLTWGNLIESNFAPVFIGEFGAHLKVDSTMTPPYTQDNADADEAWAKQLIQYQTQTKFSWAVWSFSAYNDTGMFDAMTDALPRAETFSIPQRLQDNYKVSRILPNPAHKTNYVLSVADDGYTLEWVDPNASDNTVTDAMTMEAVSGASVTIDSTGKQVNFASGNVMVAIASDSHSSDNGKYYFEIKFVSGSTSSNCAIGFSPPTEGANNQIGYQGSDNIGMFQNSGNVYLNGGTSGAAGLSFDTLGSIIRVAVDLEARKVWFGVNATWAEDPDGSDTGWVVPGTSDLLPSICSDEASEFIVSGIESTCTYTAPVGFSYWGTVANTSNETPASNVTVTPTGNITSTDVQSALAELDTKKQATGDYAVISGASNIAVVSVLPATPDSNTIYIVTT